MLNMNELQKKLDESRDIIKHSVEIGSQMASVLTEFSNQIMDIELSLKNNNLMAIPFSLETGSDNEYTYFLSIEEIQETKKRTLRLFAEKYCKYDYEKSIKRPLIQMKVQDRLQFISFLPKFLKEYNAYVQQYVNKFVGVSQ